MRTKIDKDFQDALQQKRELLYVNLLSERSVYATQLRCCGCGSLFRIHEVHDMHEVLVTKGDVSGASNEIKLAINDPRNCFFIERECHVTNRPRQVVTIVHSEIGGVTLNDMKEFLDELIRLGLDERVLNKHYGILREAKSELKHFR